MGQVASMGLTQYDVEEVISYCNNCFTQREVEGLYKRFCNVDRGHKGYISADEFLAIPELSINPLANRLVRMFESVNFREFAKHLSAFGSRATRDDKLELMFTVFDVDDDGVIGNDDLLIMLRQAAGSSLTEEDLKQLVEKILQEVGTQAVEQSQQAVPAGAKANKKHATKAKDAASAGGALGTLDLPAYKYALRDVDLSNMVVEIPVSF